MRLIIGNKNYSSWSMRPWVLLKELGIPFEEHKVLFDFSPGSPFYTALQGVGPAGRVPVAVEADGFSVWDSLAIVEYIAEQNPEKAVWPRDARQRAKARALCAEMHSGFNKLRSFCPMNVEAELQHLGPKFMAEDAGFAADLARIDQIWTEQLAAHGGPYLFGEFSAVDAFFAPVVMRVTRYGLPLSETARAYVQRMEQTSAVKAWVADALAEHVWVAEDEPYRTYSKMG
ncbi:glutathione S-transferase family protein [Pelomonas sp. SE-A7]|uniref:glutathione S-transferase family protein n=1 Tax=Pelomonas sp. SE-A7 TaxID=3054953 RepID=UPI00259C8E2C|nr:glutathione S-transferase family protein [Pelomonas sp. SE-A7]MDM4766707.1 glutathione S-transferase family protein [Pelomonas sp. SE-A7]